LLRGDDLVMEIPADRWDAAKHYDLEPRLPGRSASRWAAFLGDGFDYEFFGMGERRSGLSDAMEQ
jgi:acyl transferase domain-containing protein